MIRRALPLILLFCSGTQVAFAESGTLQGRIEQRNALPRVTRPAMPSRPMGEPLEHAATSTQGKKKAGFDLGASSVCELLDKNAFAFNLKPMNAPVADSAKAVKGGIDTTDRELVIAWEEWHKRLCATIYHYWLTYGNIPGDGVVELTIARDGDVGFDLKNYHVNLNEQFSQQQRELFDQAVEHTLQMLSHTDALAFPERSQRKEVTLTTKFSFSNIDNGEQGYTWKKGDYEKVTESH